MLDLVFTPCVRRLSVVSGARRPPHSICTRPKLLCLSFYLLHNGRLMLEWEKRIRQRRGGEEVREGEQASE